MQEKAMEETLNFLIDLAKKAMVTEDTKSTKKELQTLNENHPDPNSPIKTNSTT